MLPKTACSCSISSLLQNPEPVISLFLKNLPLEKYFFTNRLPRMPGFLNFCQTGIMTVAFLLSSLGPATGQTPIEKSRHHLLADSLLRAGNPKAAMADLSARKTAMEQRAQQQSADYTAVLFALGKLYSGMHKPDSAAIYLQTALDLHEKNAPQDIDNQIILLDALANSYERFAPRLSIPLFEKSLTLKLLVSGEDSKAAAVGYYELAINYAIFSNFEKATEYGLKAIRTMKNAGLSRDPDYGGYHQMMGWIYQEEGNLPVALDYFQQALTMLKAQLGDHFETAKCLSTIGEVYAKMGDAQQALAFQFEALAMFEKTEKRFIPICYSNIGNAYLVDRQPEKALEYLKRAQYFGLPAGKKPFPNPATYYRLSQVYLEFKDFKQAIACADTAIAALKDEEDAKMYYWYVLLVKANVKAQQFKQSNNTADLVDATQMLAEAQTTISSMIAGFNNERNKLSVYRDAVTGFGFEISIYTQLYETSHDQRWLQTAFDISEMSKGLLLYQQVLENKSRRQAIVPATLAEAEKTGRNRLIEAEKQLFEKTADTDKLRESIFQLKKQQETIRKDIEAVCPDYFLEAASFPQIQFQTIQKNLAPNEALLEYFVGDSTITAFLLRRDTLVFHRIKDKVGVEKNIAQLRESICRYFISPQKNTAIFLQSAKDYTESAFSLYQTLMAPFGNLLPEQLTIVPDGVLAYLPFEALLQEKPERPDRFHLHHYIAKDFTIRYACSATLLREMENLPILAASSDRLLAMAPYFDGSTNWSDSLLAYNGDRSRFDFSALPYSGEEVYKIAKTTGGVALSGHSASKETFMQEAPKYHTLHLATHAQANDMAGDFSFLAFAPTGAQPNSNRLYVSEIYGLLLNAELVTLSACETGLGQLYRGEGIVSIARAFASAGAHSIVQSQWVVSDAQTRRLMEFFYENLKKGQAKDKALHEARQEYLRTFRGEEAHPYFWASFILIGDKKPLSFFKK
jgi:CHAT domain-containing protein